MRFSSAGESDAASSSMVPRNSASRSRYPSDLSDPEWELIKPLIPPAKRGGGQRTVNLREKSQPQCARISPPLRSALCSERCAILLDVAEPLR
jgi:hypothetical protein